jgi:hypothetical protein
MITGDVLETLRCLFAALGCICGALYTIVIVLSFNAGRK